MSAWVKSRHVQCKSACPLYPQKRKYARRVSDAKETADETRRRVRSRMDAADRTLAEAKQNEGRRLAAAALGESSDVIPAGDAQIVLE